MSARGSPNRVAIRRVASAGDAPIDGLVDLLIDVVSGGASVGFLAPLARETAAHYWNGVAGSLGDALAPWVAEVDGRVGAARRGGSVRARRSPYAARARHARRLPGEGVYRHLGWHRVGEVPGYAADPDGTLMPTAYYYKQLPC
jgi:acetyltransferase